MTRMKSHAKRIVFWSGLTVAAYLVLYFSTVQPFLFKRAGPATPIPSYAWPSDGEFIHAVFAPAHLIDAAFLRRGYWAPKETSPNPAAAMDGWSPVLFAFLAHLPTPGEPR